MMFCQKCGGIMMPKDGKMVCYKCGFKSQEKDSDIKEKVKQEKSVEIVEEETTAYPLVDKICPKCGHNKAHYWEIQTRAGDEAATQFFKCEKCKHTWRNYD